MRTSPLGRLTPRAFLRRYWQKRPLLVRGALRGLADAVDRRTLFALAERDDVESRIVERRGARRETRHGPFGKLRCAERDWTLLVNGVNLHVAAADALLRRFQFIPQARLDDVMVSYAAPGGGVGPHADSYDVFLLQGPGSRRWRVGAERHVLQTGDLLYVPPGWQHDGVALEPCFTYSIGFRAPRGAELAAAFLDWLHERGLPDALYRDPALAPAARPGRIPPQMISFAVRSLQRIRWSGADAARFLGEYLSTPKPHVVFRPGRAAAPLRRAMVRLDAKTQLLYSGGRFFMNGESLALAGPGARALRELADRRSARGAALAAARLGALLSGWRRLGYLHYERV